MADKKITELTELAAAPSADDLVAIVDTNEIPSETKKIKISNLLETSNITGALTDGSDADSLHTHSKYIPEQDISYYVGTITTTSSNTIFQTNSDGSVGVLFFRSTGSNTDNDLIRFERDTITGQYVMTHFVTSTVNSDNPFLCVGSNYVYLGFSTGGTEQFVRFDIADLTNETAISVSGTPWVNGDSGFSDGTNLYAYSTNDTIFKYTVSGTTATYDSSITLTDAGALQYRGLTCDGTNIFTTNDENGEIVINKYALSGGAIVSTVTRYVYSDAYENNSPIKLYPATDDALGIAFTYSNYDESGMISSTMHLMAITKP